MLLSLLVGTFFYALGQLGAEKREGEAIRQREETRVHMDRRFDALEDKLDGVGTCIRHPAPVEEINTNLYCEDTS